MIDRHATFSTAVFHVDSIINSITIVILPVVCATSDYKKMSALHCRRVAQEEQ
jgi:hypothetical protein